MKQTVLMVDDDLNLIEGVQRTLRGEPYRVLTALGGEKALEVLASQHVDVLVSDNQMPGIGGLELLTNVRQNYPAIINLMLSGQASIGTVVQALNQGQIFRFLIKPCGQDELRHNIRQALAHKLLLDGCRLMLPMFRRQAALLSAIERKHPGMIRSVEPTVGTVITPRMMEDAITTEDLSERMDVEIRRAGDDRPKA